MLPAPTETVLADLAPGGELRAAINLGNPVLAQGTEDDPRGVTVDIARAVAGRLDVPLRLLCSGAARHSLAQLSAGEADLAFLAVEPARAQEVAFTSPYVVIEGVYAVPAGSPAEHPDDLDRPGIRIGVKEGSAYDLFLTRTLEHAELVRGTEGTAVFLEQTLDAGAGIREPVTAFVESRDDVRLLPERFMQIQQAVACRRDRQQSSVDWLDAVVGELRDGGEVAASLRASGRSESLVARPSRRVI